MRETLGMIVLAGEVLLERYAAHIIVFGGLTFILMIENITDLIFNLL